MNYIYLFNNLLFTARNEPWLSSILSMDLGRFKTLAAKLTVFVTLLASVISLQPTAQGQVSTPIQKFEVSESVDSKQLDDRAKILADYLAAHDSPLQYHAQDFIDAADAYQMDWKLVPAISGVESTFGKAIPGGYNAWGWGVYGDQALGFKSWRDGIFTVSGGLKQNYIDKGLTDPFSMNHVYAASPAWGAHVNFFLNDLDNYVKNYPTQPQKQTEIKSQVKIAGASAQLAS